MGVSHSARRSCTESRCGDVYTPVERPCAQRIRPISRAVVVLPFVPVTWMVGYVSCGSSRSFASPAIRERSGTIRSGWRASSSRSASSMRIAIRSAFGASFDPLELLELLAKVKLLPLQLGVVLPLALHSLRLRLGQELLVAELAFRLLELRADLVEPLAARRPRRLHVELRRDLHRRPNTGH